MRKEKLRWFGIPKLFPYLKGYGKLVIFDMLILGLLGTAMDAVIPLLQQYAIDHFIAEKTMDGIGGFLALSGVFMNVYLKREEKKWVSGDKEERKESGT